MMRLKYGLAILTLLTLGSTLGCTTNLPISFLQQNEVFSAVQEVNTKVDLLWVVDNSASMDVSQEKLRTGFAAFANKYMKPTWDIRVAVITTDTYLANSAFSTYLNTTISGTVGYTSSYIQGRLATWQNPSWNPTLVNTTTGAFDSGIKYGELSPVWNSDYGKLLAGNHDGPTPAICFELLKYFYGGVSDCRVRDDQSAYSGTSKCLNPGSGESSLSQCVNTIQNDTVRSGKAIIETALPDGQTESVWQQQLIDDFTVNMTTGSSGHGSERGLGSVTQLLADNEPTSTAFFRKDSIRGIIFVSDEDDQTMTLPASPGAGFSPWTDYKCDQAGLVALNGASITTSYCCASGCTYGAAGTSCSSKTVDSHTYTPSLCIDDSNLQPVSEIKDTLDSFFRTLDEAEDEADPNYFIASIVPTTGDAIQSMQSDRTAMDTQVGEVKTIAVDRGDRYIELGDLVGNGSLSMNIADADYSSILDLIGQKIVEEAGTFSVSFTPTTKDDMLVTIIHSDKTITIIPSEDYDLDGKTITLHLDVVLSFKTGDQIAINYQPLDGE